MSDVQEYYLALLQLQMAVLSLVIAGVVALMQIITNAKPQRHIGLLIRQRYLLAYIFSLAFLLVLIAFGAWVLTFETSAQILFGNAAVTLFADGPLPLLFLILCLADLFVFAFLTFKAREVLDSRQYILRYARRLSPARLRNYLPQVYVESMESTGKRARRSVKQSAKPYDVADPLQPIREFIKDNAFKSYDYGTATGLRVFSQAFDASFELISKNPKAHELYYLSRYFGESALEFFTIFEKNASEKRKMDMLRLLHEKGEKFAQLHESEGLLTIIRSLEDIASTAADDDEIIAAVGYIHNLTNLYLDRHKKAKWSTVAPIFDEICLSVTRLSETYYLQSDDPLKTVPIIGYYTGEHRTVTAALVDFFTSYKDLADRYPDAYPQYYFEAVEAVNEALFARLAEVVAEGRGMRGFTSVYHTLAESLYSLYFAFGTLAIEHKKIELLALCMGNLRRILKPAKNFNLDAERRAVTRQFVELGLKGVATFGDVALKGKRTISMYMFETLEKHGARRDIAEAVQAVLLDEAIQANQAVNALSPRLQKTGSK